MNNHGCGITVSVQEVSTALAAMKRRGINDHYGFSVQGCAVVAEARPAAFARAISMLAGDTDELRSLVIEGRAKAKTKGAIPAGKIRTIMPLPVLLGILDFIVAMRMHSRSDAIARALPYGYLECAVKGRQVMDIVFPASLVIEKGMDMMSRGCVAQADIKKFYDNLRPLLLYRWMVQNGYTRELASTFVRLHLCPQVSIRVGEQHAIFKARCSGTLTGSRSAGAGGRLPLFDVCQHHLQKWNANSFQIEGRSFSLASFVDNLVTTSTSPAKATEMLDSCELYLTRHWGLVYGEDSREFVICRGDTRVFHVAPLWKQVSTMKCLGHHLADDGGIFGCMKAVEGAMWRAFFGNLTGGLLRCTDKVKSRFLVTNILAVASSRWARWPYQKNVALALDTTQRKMLAHLMQIKPATGEPYDAFCQRRRLVCGKKAAAMGRWSKKWASSTVAWAAHVERRHDEKAWSHTILGWHDSSWLQLQRLLHSIAGESRTRTRCIRGAPARRWQDGLAEAKQASNNR